MVENLPRLQTPFKDNLAGNLEAGARKLVASEFKPGDCFKVSTKIENHFSKNRLSGCQ